MWLLHFQKKKKKTESEAQKTRQKNKKVLNRKKKIALMFGL